LINDDAARCAFSEFRYETSQDVAVRQTEVGIKAILGNPAMINAYKEGIPGNGKPFPEGSMVVKIEWSKKKNAASPYFVDVPDTLKSVSFIEKDSKRFWTRVDRDMPSFYVTQRLIRSNLSGAIAHSGRKPVSSAMPL